MKPSMDILMDVMTKPNPGDAIGIIPLDSAGYGAYEKDPNGIAPNTPGAKLDANKAPIYEGLLDYFPRACEAVANVSKYGATKYTWKGWEKVKNGINRYLNAMLRHVTKLSKEGEWDSEAKNDPKYPADIMHRAQIAWNAMASLELKLREMENKNATAL